MSKKYLYYFSEGSQAFGGDKTAMRNTLGGKGSGLAEMTAAGMPVPQGFTITTEACTQYYADGRQINAEIQADIFAHVKGLEELTGKKLGDVENPLLVSVRSGARQSMPGMMDTILNLGLNDASVEGLAKKTGNPRFAYDSYRRFVQMFADEVRLDAARFQRAVAAVGRDDIVPRPGAQAHAVETGRADDITGIFQIHSSFPEFSPAIVPHFASREKNCV